MRSSIRLQFGFPISSMFRFFIIEKSEVENYDDRNYDFLKMLLDRVSRVFRGNLKQYKRCSLMGDMME